MKIVSKIFGILLALAGLAVAAFTVKLCFDNQDSIPVLLAPVEAAQHQADALMEAVSNGDYETAGSLIVGNPSLGMDREPADTAGKLIWEAFMESYEYELVGECYATDSGVAQNVRVTYLDMASVTENLRQRSQVLLEAGVAGAEDVSEIYDENNEYRESFVMEVLEQAVRDALQEDVRYTGMDLTINLVYSEGEWLVVSDSRLMEAITGGVVK